MSPSANAQYHLELLMGGMPYETIQERCPVYPLDAVGMPAPGPDFIAEGRRRGDPECKITPATFSKRVGDLPFLTALYHAALYSENFSLPVEYQFTTHTSSFVPGHLRERNRVGPARATVMILGKCPGREEVRARTNFVGPASDVLWNTLEELGIDYQATQAWYLANAVRFPNIDLDKSALPASWVKDCLPLLHQELRLVRPDYLLCLGSEAAKAVLGRSAKIGDLIGQTVDLTIPMCNGVHYEPAERDVNVLGKVSSFDHTIKVMGCTHPAHVTRNPDELPQFTAALRFFVRCIRGCGTLEEANLERVYVRTNDELVALADKILSEAPGPIAPLAVDCEWHGKRPEEGYLRTIQLSHKAKFGAAIILRETGGARNTGLDLGVVLGQLERVMRSRPGRHVRLIGHNLKADLPWLVHLGIDVRDQFDAPNDDPPPGKLGWEKTRTEGGFDTLYATHALVETGPFKLEVVGSQFIGTPRYDLLLDAWLDEHCKSRGMKRDALEGYGDVPEDLLLPYSVYDVDLSFRLFELFNGNGTDKSGMLDCDRYGNCAREAFWRTQKTALPFLEMETTGILVDRARVEQLIDIFQQSKSAKLAEFRNAVGWVDFNPESTYHRRAILFGDRFVGRRNKDGTIITVLPAGVQHFGLTPIKPSGKGKAAVPYEDLYADEPCPLNQLPSTDRETISILAGSSSQPLLKLLRDLRYVAHALKTTLRPPRGPEPDDDEGSEPVYEKGLLSYVDSDGAVRTHFFPVETGRVSSSKPNCQNFSGQRDADYQRILGSVYKHSIRSCLKARPGCVFIDADYTGAEVAVAAWLSNDANLIEHARRSTLPDDHPDFYDIHSSLAVRAFQLGCLPTKKGLDSIGKKHYRVAAKSVVFGRFYGQGAEALARTARSKEAPITVQQAQELIAALTQMYPDLDKYFDKCRRRVVNPGWSCTCFGRYRRFPKTNDRQKQGEFERQSMNMGTQSGVADAMALALANLRQYRFEHPEVKFSMVLQVHDAVMLEVPIEWAEYVYDVVLPLCMVEQVPVIPCDLDGFPLGTGPYHLGIGCAVYEYWGEELTVERCRELDLSERLASH